MLQSLDYSRLKFVQKFIVGAGYRIQVLRSTDSALFKISFISFAEKVPGGSSPETGQRILVDKIHAEKNRIISPSQAGIGVHMIQQILHIIAPVLIDRLFKRQESFEPVSGV